MNYLIFSSKPFFCLYHKFLFFFEITLTTLHNLLSFLNLENLNFLSIFSRITVDKPISQELIKSLYSINFGETLDPIILFNLLTMKYEQ